MVFIFLITDSDYYETKDERVKVLKKEIKSFSNFKNAEFELFNTNGFSNSRPILPGASSWDYKFVIKVNSFDVGKWTTGMILIEPKGIDETWMKKVIQKRKNDWVTESTPEFYIRNGDNVKVVVYRSEGIIFKRVTYN